MGWNPGQQRYWHYTQVPRRLSERDPRAEWNESTILGRIKMRMGRKNIVMKTHEGLKIISVSAHHKHSHEVAVAPDNFLPGDERFLNLSREGKVLFDHANHKRHHEALAKAKEVELKKDEKVSEWNESSPLERFKNKLTGSKK